MKLYRFLRAGAVCAAAMLTACLSAAAAYADENDYVLPSDQEEPETFTSGDYVYSLLDSADGSGEKAACIEHYTGSDAELKIPSELDGYEVVQLGDYAFVAAYTVTDVTIPASVLGLGTFTFAECTNVLRYNVEEGNPYFERRDGVLYANGGTALMRYPVGTHPTELVFEEPVTSIGNAAFTCCKSLESVTFTDSIVYIGNSAFADCTTLTEIEIPSSVTAIESFAFNNCASLAKVTLPDTITSIGAAAFTNTALTEITIPSSCTEIGQQAFAGTNLTEVTIPKSVTSIGYSAFGWRLNAYNEMARIDDFVIYGYAGSIAESYASDAENKNDFTFIALDDEETDSSESSAESESIADSTADSTDEGGFGIGRIIGLICCGVLLVIIAVVAVLSGKKDKQENQDKKQDKNQKKDKKEDKPEKKDKNQKQQTEQAETADESDEKPEKEDDSDET